MKPHASPVIIAVAALAFSSTAWALPGVDIGLGVFGLAGASIIDQVSGGSEADKAYPGFAGTRTGIGFTLEARVLGMLGIEAGYIKSSDKGSGDIKFGAYDVSASLGQTATHIPVVLKFVLPIPVFKPFALVGIDYVSPDACEATLKTGGVTIPTTCYNASYSMWTAGIGAEIALPIPGLDIRIPFSVRGSKHRDFGDTMAADRGTITLETSPRSANLRSEWRYDVYGTVGAAIFF